MIGRPEFPLQPGDVLLYRAREVYGYLIALKTWHPVSHVEVSLGGGESVASRDGLGVNRYPTRYEDLGYVLRPQPLGAFDCARAVAWFEQHAKGLPYGWLDLLQFIALDVNAPGIVCSPFATEFLRAGGVPVFNAEPPEKVAPFEFLLSEHLQCIWTAPEIVAAAAKGQTMSKLQNVWQKIGMGAGSIATLLGLAQQAGYLNLLPPQAAAAVGAVGVIVGGVSALYHAAPGSTAASPAPTALPAQAGK